MANSNHKFKKDDEVIVIAGKDKGNRGSVSKVLPNGRLVVAGINMVKKHQRPDPNRGIQGGIVEQEASIHCSNVAIYNAQTNKADRIGYKIGDDGKKSRIFKSSGDNIDA